MVQPFPSHDRAKGFRKWRSVCCAILCQTRRRPGRRQPKRFYNPMDIQNMEQSKMKMPTSRLALCSWSLQPANPQDLLAKVQDTGVPRVQLALDPLRESPAVWGSVTSLFQANGIDLASGMFGCVGEDYSTLDSIRLTGGIAPDTTWPQNLRNIRATAELAGRLGLHLVTFHAGFLPHEESDPAFNKMLFRLREVADFFQAQDIALALETGQETAPILFQVLQSLDRSNVGVNFDPANMLLYDKGDPVGALHVLGPWIRQVHIKDARRTKVPGTWGEEVPAGTGEVDWPAFFRTLKQFDFTGDFVIEREAGKQRVQDIRDAKTMVERHLK
jgi:L-ribulose-5-phosphate 3-epimerase